MKALVLFSGGLDSATCLAMAVQKYGAKQVVALSVSYGQKHNKELEAARNVANYYQVELIELNLSKIFSYSNCSLLSHSSKEIPRHSYAEQLAEQKEEILSTYVPFRNGLFLSTATSIALSKDCNIIFYGAHGDDAAGNAYPDCSPAFHKAMNTAIYEGSGRQVRVEAPFLGLHKKEIVKRGLDLNVPYELTWSCYEGGEHSCGQCGTCIDREKAFEENNSIDPLVIVRRGGN
ncbi:MAG TPA: 7-cyano-7-deazaguanine synthase QueC [Fusobacterium sp.]|uniref:7-cyano-7-deazaguanine synthase QueC n=1 Tax=Fusobacterium sp. TaxID=68766 RepID=UPI002F404FD2